LVAAVLRRVLMNMIYVRCFRPWVAKRQ
jgi:hypothetical protein